MSSKYNLTTVKLEWPLIATTYLQALWALNEGTFAKRSEDGSGNGNHITTLTNLQWGDGVSDKCLALLDRVSIRAAYGAAIDGSAWTALSLSFWASKTAAATAVECLMSYTDEATAGIRITCASAASVLGITFYRAGGLSEAIVPNWPIDATLRHYVLTFDLATLAWITYRDGVEMSSGTLSNIPVMPNNKFVLCNVDTPAAANGWVGYLDEVRVYNAVLTTAEIAYLIRNPGQIPRGPYDFTGLNTVLSGATLTVYDGRQPATVDTALASENNVLARFTFPSTPLGKYGVSQIDVLDLIADTQWLRSGTPTFARVTTVAPAVAIFDCSVGLVGDSPDLVIKQSPVRIRDVAHIEKGDRTLEDVDKGLKL